MQATNGAFSMQSSNGQAIDGLAVCAASASDSAALCADSAHYLTWPLPAGNDIVLAVDDAMPRHAVMFDPGAPTIALSPEHVVTDTVVPGQAAVHSLAHADVDGDGAPELIASFGAATQDRAESLAGMVVVCEVDATGQVDRVHRPRDDDRHRRSRWASAVCVDAAAGLVTDYQRGGPSPVPTTELLMVCHRPTPKITQVFRVAWDGSQYTSEPALEVAEHDRADLPR